MVKLAEAERIELKGAMCRIIHLVLEIDTKMKPSLKDRVDALPNDHTSEDLQDMYDKYVEEMAEQYVQRIERD